LVSGWMKHFGMQCFFSPNFVIKLRWWQLSITWFSQICTWTKYDSINAYASFYIVGYLLELIMAVGSLCILALRHELHRNRPNLFDAASAVEFIKFPPYHLVLLLGRTWHAQSSSTHAQYVALQQ
jgi:hypothetical protein